ncbi:E3 ubiquitin-protein ligase MARCH2 [Intoshia linei]|uniref:E3 ubiquitin-protein ligase MARCH2 n=1 Tax=Intoshia linei TaxID=1819745 RepID=A0A177ASH2_9BILA|nr:E3 ubiquitin-protein ligase MARCH2 [Intoshia linei]
MSMIRNANYRGRSNSESQFTLPKQKFNTINYELVNDTTVPVYQPASIPKFPFVSIYKNYSKGEKFADACSLQLYTVPNLVSTKWSQHFEKSVLLSEDEKDGSRNANEITNPICNNDENSINLKNQQNSSVSISIYNDCQRSHSNISDNNTTISFHSSPTCSKMCRYCQSTKNSHTLISPCKCIGTMAYVHDRCLRRWIRNKSKNGAVGSIAQTCELCETKYNSKKRAINLRNIIFPRLKKMDKIYNIASIIFSIIVVVSFFVMMSSFKFDQSLKSNGSKTKENSKLRENNNLIMATGLLFVISFFVVLTLQLRTKQSIYSYIKRFIRKNKIYEYRDYSRNDLVLKPIQKTNAKYNT